MARTLMIILLLLALPVLRANAEIIKIEAEDFFNYGQIEGCGQPITAHACEGASGGMAADGVDCDGEWIELHLTVAVADSFFLGLRSAGVAGDVRTFRFDFLADDAHQTLMGTMELTTQPGLGLT